MGAQEQHDRRRGVALDPGQRGEALAGEPFGQQRQEVEHDRASGELVVGGVQEPFDGLGAEHAVELALQVGRRGGRASCWSMDRSGGGSRWSRRSLLVLRRSGTACTAGVRRVMRSVSSSTTLSNAAGSSARHGVGDRPVQPRPPDRHARGAGGEFFVGAVADGHDQVGGVEDVVGRGGAVRAPGRGVGGGRRRPRRDAPGARGGCPRRWPGPGCGRSTSRPPAASGPSCGCTRTPPAPPSGRRRSGVRRSRASRVERDVAAASVSFGAVPGHQPDLFQHAQVMGQQVRRHPEPGGQLARRRLTPGQGVDDREPSGIAERGMQRRPPRRPNSGFASVDIESMLIERSSEMSTSVRPGRLIS